MTTFLRYFLPLLCLLAGFWFYSAQRTLPLADLQVVTVSELAPGMSLPLRALLLRSDRATYSVPEVVDADFHVAAYDASGEVLASTSMTPAAVPGAEAVLQLAADTPEQVLKLMVSARQGKDPAKRLSVPIRISKKARGAALRSRQAGALPHLWLGTMTNVVGHFPRDSLQVRVQNGVCVPETNCVVFVHFARSAFQLHVEELRNVTVLQAPSAFEHCDIVMLKVKVHGADASLRLSLKQAVAGQKKELSRTVAYRDLRLPVALGQVAVDAPLRVLSNTDSPKLVFASSTPMRALAVDAYLATDAGEFWQHTASYNAEQLLGADKGLRPFSALAPGTWRFQVHQGFLGASPPTSLYLRIDAGNGIKSTKNSQVCHEFGYEFAKFEEDHRVLPEVWRSLPAARLKQHRRISMSSKLLGALWLLCALLLSLSFFARGKAAEKQAREVFATLISPSDSWQDRKQRWFTLAFAFGIFVVLLLALLLVQVTLR